jgi:hypothetical protein
MLSVGPDRASPGLACRRTRARGYVVVCVFVCAGRVSGVCVEGGCDRWVMNPDYIYVADKTHNVFSDYT